MRFPKSALGAALGVAALVLAACGGGSNNPLGQSSASSPSGGASGAVVVGSANFTESEVLAELYAQAMKAKGVNASTKLNACLPLADCRFPRWLSAWDSPTRATFHRRFER